jgi:secondary thiamine-phosphate synthase enzyme
MQTLEIRTPERTVFVDITAQLQDAVAAEGVEDGALVVAVQHTTAGITINENADPSVRKDMLMALDRLVPETLPFTHAEGNSDAHVKASIVGNSVTVPLSGGRLKLGTWQGVYFCEFDGPRRRRVDIVALPAQRG